MNTDMDADTSATMPAAAAGPDTAAAAPRRLAAIARLAIGLSLVCSVASLVLAGWMWQQQRTLQQQLAQQVADMALHNRDAGLMARQAMEQSRDGNAKVALLETRVAEWNAQRTQIDTVLQNLARAKDDGLLADVDAALQLGRQQSMLTGSTQPMLAALTGAEKRLAAAQQPSLVALHAAVTRDIDDIKRASVTDVPVQIGRIDNVLRQLDTLPLRSSVVPAVATAAKAQEPASAPVAGWRDWLARLVQGMRDLVQVRTLEHPDAALLPPEQGRLLREHLRMRLLNARMALLARQIDISRHDLEDVRTQLGKYFDSDSALVQSARSTLEDVARNIHSAELPAMTATLQALSAARSPSTRNGH